MDAALREEARWLIPIYQLPREPSRHRVAVWRRLKALGALYLRTERRRDHVRSPLRSAVSDALRKTRKALRGDASRTDARPVENP